MNSQMLVLEQHLITPLPLDQLDFEACTKLVFRVRETLLLTLGGSEAYFVCQNNKYRSFVCSKNRKSLFWARKKPLRAPAPEALLLNTEIT